jgi:hypothetical protein
LVWVVPELRTATPSVQLNVLPNSYFFIWAFHRGPVRSRNLRVRRFPDTRMPIILTGPGPSSSIILRLISELSYGNYSNCRSTGPGIIHYRTTCQRRSENGVILAV